MAKFDYEGRNASGATVKGTITANSKQDVSSALMQKGIILIQAKEAAAKPALSFLNAKRPLKVAELVTFITQLHALYKAGVPLLQAIERIEEGTRSRALKTALKEIIADLDSGKDLSTGLRNQGKLFPTLLVDIVKVGEKTGQLENALIHVKGFIELGDETVKKVKGVIRYPIIVICAISIAMVVVNIFVIPQFAKMFKDLGSDLPMPTKVLIFTSDLTVNYWYIILGSFLAAVIGFIMYYRTPAGRFSVHRILLSIPVAGDLIKRVLFVRFARTFALTIRTDVPLIQGIELVANSVGNEFFKFKVMQMRDWVNNGETLIGAAKKLNLFSTLVLQMLKVGEETGGIDGMLEQVASYYEREVDFEIARLQAIIEPLLLIIIGILVAFLAMGIFMPMVNFGKAMTKK